MSRLLKLALLGGIAYVLWKLLSDGYPNAPREAAPAPERSTEPASPNGGSSSASPSKAELYERAKELGIEGRSKMSKQQLERAIGEAS
jgi:hypothetical protein